MIGKICIEEPNILCSECFEDQGLRINAFKLGVESSNACPNCGNFHGRKLTKQKTKKLAWIFFVLGTTSRFEFGAAPALQMNEFHFGKSDIEVSEWLKSDVKLLENKLEIGFFHYGPRLWMLGEVEPLKELQCKNNRSKVINRIINEYPEITLRPGDLFYRLRINPSIPHEQNEYDSPPLGLEGNGRLDSKGFPVMYASQDIDICIHESRANPEDEIYIATLKAQKDMRLLDLTFLIKEDVTEFESLDLAIHMTFLASSHSYDISRSISLAAKQFGFDGIIYPSYFSLMRTGGHPLETVYGLSLRRFHPNAVEYAKSFTIGNFALFGRPIEEKTVIVNCINRLTLTQISYESYLGPVTY